MDLQTARRAHLPDHVAHRREMERGARGGVITDVMILHLEAQDQIQQAIGKRPRLWTCRFLTDRTR